MIELYKVSETATTETIGWAPVDGAVGYKFTTNGKVSHTWDGARDQVRIAKGATLQIEALAVADSGTWPVTTPQFGADLFEDFEWALQELTRTVVYVDTTSELRAAVINEPGATINGGGKTFALGGQLTLPNHGVLTTLFNAKLTGGRVLHRDGRWRLRNLIVDNPPVAEEDCIKGDSGGFLDIDHCALRGAPRQGILLAPHSDVVIRNSRIQDNGRDTTFDHGIYTAGGNRLLMFNNEFRDNAAYQLHMYPVYAIARIVCNTFIGGKGSILSGVTNAKLIGNVFQDSSRYGLEQLQPCANVQVSDCLSSNNTLGAFNMGAGVTVVRPRTSGSPKDIISVTEWGYVPPTDIDGTPRVTADAGAYAA